MLYWKGVKQIYLVIIAKKPLRWNRKEPLATTCLNKANGFKLSLNAKGRRHERNSIINRDPKCWSIWQVGRLEDTCLSLSNKKCSNIGVYHSRKKLVLSERKSGAPLTNGKVKCFCRPPSSFFAEGNGPFPLGWTYNKMENAESTKYSKTELEGKMKRDKGKP